MLLLNHADASALAEAVAERIAQALDDALVERGAALLALAGGRTSPPVFRALAAQPRDWARVTITPSDERWVARDHADCNLAQMQAAFAGAQGIDWLPLVPEQPSGAADAAFANARLAAHPEAFDLAMLGMGADGHFASIFPGASNLPEALGLAQPVDAASAAILPLRSAATVGTCGSGFSRDLSPGSPKRSRLKPLPHRPGSARHVVRCAANMACSSLLHDVADRDAAGKTPAAVADAIAIIPDPLPTAGPHPRISLTLARLLRSRRLLLVITGADKRAVLEQAQASGDWRRWPVAALLAAAHPNAQIHWSP